MSPGVSRCPRSPGHAKERRSPHYCLPHSPFAMDNMRLSIANLWTLGRLGGEEVVGSLTTILLDGVPPCHSS